MKAAVLAILISAAVCTDAQAETAVRGFNPRFVVTPSNPDNPNYRPPDRPAHTFDFSIGIDISEDDDRRDRNRKHRRERGRKD